MTDSYCSSIRYCSLRGRTPQMLEERSRQQKTLIFRDLNSNNGSTNESVYGIINRENFELSIDVNYPRNTVAKFSCFSIEDFRVTPRLSELRRKSSRISYRRSLRRVSVAVSVGARCRASNSSSKGVCLLARPPPRLSPGGAWGKWNTGAR